MENIPTNDIASFERLANDAMAHDYPARFNSREEWVAYNKQCAQYDSERAALKGGSYHEYHEMMCEKQRADSRDRIARFVR